MLNVQNKNRSSQNELDDITTNVLNKMFVINFIYKYHIYAQVSTKKPNLQNFYESCIN